MIKTWTFENQTYTSEWAVRQAVFNKKRIAFGETPSEGVIEFWEKVGVTYLERDYTPEEQESIDLEKAKRERAIQVRNIKVVVDGMTFDGDESAQSRMARAITAAETAGLAKTVWVLADNTVAEVTKEQLQQALSKAMIAMGELWTKPYIEEPAKGAL